MARTDNLNNFLTDVADAIRTKTGSQASILAENFDTEIENIPSGGGDLSDYFTSTIEGNQQEAYIGVLGMVKKIPSTTTVNGTSLQYAFYRCRALTEIPLLDTSNVTNFISAFGECRSLTTIPLLNTSSGTNFNLMFAGCQALTTIPLINTSRGTNFTRMFWNCYALTSIPLLDTSNGTAFSAMFSNTQHLTTIPQLDTSKGTALDSMFAYSHIEVIPELDAGSADYIRNMFDAMSSTGHLTTFGGLKDLGKAYLTTSSTNNLSYKLDLSGQTNLTHDSLMNVINKLYDIATAGVQTQQLVLGSTNLAKLSSDEINTATNKGWSVS